MSGGFLRGAAADGPRASCHHWPPRRPAAERYISPLGSTMQRRCNVRRSSLAASLWALLLSACASIGTMQPFSTDGCSLFPDRSLIGKADWCRCCVAHDLAYWRGGTSEARLNADRELRACVYKASGNEALAELMFAGARAGGGPYLYTSYRWGYGWPFGRSYGQLTPEEEALASSLEREYLAENLTLPCSSDSPSFQ